MKGSYDETVAKVRALSESYPDGALAKKLWPLRIAVLADRLQAAQFDDWRRKNCGCWACEMRPVWRAIRSAHPHQTEDWR